MRYGTLAVARRRLLSGCRRRTRGVLDGQCVWRGLYLRRTRLLLKDGVVAQTLALTLLTISAHGMRFVALSKVWLAHAAKREVGLEHLGLASWWLSANHRGRLLDEGTSGLAQHDASANRVPLKSALTFILLLRHVKQPVLVRRLISFLWRPPDRTRGSPCGGSWYRMPLNCDEPMLAIPMGWPGCAWPGWA